jgi:serine protease Do
LPTSSVGTLIEPRRTYWYSLLAVGVIRSAAPQGAQLGLALRPLQLQELRGSGLDHGLLIERVTGPAQLAGVQPSDVLLALNGKPVQDIAEARAAMKDSPKQVALLVARDGQQIFVPVRLG